MKLEVRYPKFPAFFKEGTDLRSVQQANQGWLCEFRGFNHPCVIRWMLHDAVPSFVRRGIQQIMQAKFVWLTPMRMTSIEF
jgi:hypothetical protein